MGAATAATYFRILTEGPHVHRNLSTPQLVEAALARGEASLAANGALVAYTGSRTGRSPRDKFIVEDEETRTRVDWGKVNQPFPPEKFEALLERVVRHMAERDLYVMDLFAGADPTYRLPVTLVAEYAWHALFVKQLFIRPEMSELASHAAEFTIIAAPEFEAVPERDGTLSSTFILSDFTRKIILIGGTKYAGEMKKSIFGVMNYLLPERDVFPMHCSANIGPEGDTALFFGLSGTGKTTLSADPLRMLIGDDEHGWGPKGVFNFEGGCYAKCVDLSEEKEPQIFHAIRFGSVLENVVINARTGEPDYSDIRHTENTRAAYPIEFIENAVIPGIGGHPKNVLFLAADAFGVLPPIARLTPEQAMYHFLSGYTAKLAGTEAGLGSEPVPEFSTCFASPFLPLAPRVYAEMLGERLRQHGADCWLVNTGWTGGAFGAGRRMSLKHTRAMVHAAIDGRLAQAEFVTEPAFGLSIPTSCPDVPAELLNPRNAWPDKHAYDAQARLLAKKFEANFAKFDALESIRAAGPRVSR
ncbi:phosphoenolpyruvate carboxykinase (ATP) [Acidipila rosea]|uniref:Phosphoenolpyruvate carboxykinase (ATP) n=1 Tax=Acidipila rosea TaxID=768535 RepID=A0A4R1LC19_9BACT|nr:phosphoenolpyruvate carboxykinase (ATP) [Acidipila rosea]MBW4045994.1 phosphoenolpyruvate carboxykinase (ATP) [Acidobacteriota bacterium]TCK75117.1 phosphoenolpyruvate carboxykinase (ATP) [Acidipila rosea]